MSDSVKIDTTCLSVLIISSYGTPLLMVFSHGTQNVRIGFQDKFASSWKTLIYIFIPLQFELFFRRFLSLVVIIKFVQKNVYLLEYSVFLLVLSILLFQDCIMYDKQCLYQNWHHKIRLHVYYYKLRLLEEWKYEDHEWMLFSLFEIDNQHLVLN